MVLVTHTCPSSHRSPSFNTSVPLLLPKSFFTHTRPSSPTHLSLVTHTSLFTHRPSSRPAHSSHPAVAVRPLCEHQTAHIAHRNFTATHTRIGTLLYIYIYNHHITTSTIITFIIIYRLAYVPTYLLYISYMYFCMYSHTRARTHIHTQQHMICRAVVEAWRRYTT